MIIHFFNDLTLTNYDTAVPLSAGAGRVPPHSPSASPRSTLEWPRSPF